MATVQLPDSKRFDNQIAAHTAIQNTYVNLAQEFQKYLSNESRKHFVINHGKHKKVKLKKWKNRQYRVLHNKHVNHQDVKIYCVTKQFPKHKVCRATQQTT